jgi:HSP20 family protein
LHRPCHGGARTLGTPRDCWPRDLRERIARIGPVRRRFFAFAHRNPLPPAASHWHASCSKADAAAVSAAKQKETDMSIVRWDPLRELEEVSNRLNSMFSRSSLATSENGKDTMTTFDWAPSVDISETADEFLVKAELPEVKKEDVKVSLDGGVLRIEGERKQEKEEKGKKFHRVERSYGSFLRSFSLPENIDDAKVQAEFKDGVLNVRLPKSQQAKPKSVQVKIN